MKNNIPPLPTSKRGSVSVTSGSANNLALDENGNKENHGVEIVKGSSSTMALAFNQRSSTIPPLKRSNAKISGPPSSPSFLTSSDTLKRSRATVTSPSKFHQVNTGINALSSSNWLSTPPVLNSSPGLSTTAPVRVLRFGEKFESFFCLPCNQDIDIYFAFRNENGEEVQMKWSDHRERCWDIAHDINGSAKDVNKWKQVLEVACHYVDREFQRDARLGESLIRLLERAVDRFRSEENAATSRTAGALLDIWLFYARACARYRSRDEAKSIFDHMQTRLLGEKASSLYIAWADFELSGCKCNINIKHTACACSLRAKEIVEFGLEREAQPLEHLKMYHENNFRPNIVPNQEHLDSDRKRNMDANFYLNTVQTVSFGLGKDKKSCNPNQPTVESQSIYSLVLVEEKSIQQKNLICTVPSSAEPSTYVAADVYESDGFRQDVTAVQPGKIDADTVPSSSDIAFRAMMDSDSTSAHQVDHLDRKKGTPEGDGEDTWDSEISFKTPIVSSIDAIVPLVHREIHADDPAKATVSGWADSKIPVTASTEMNKEMVPRKQYQLSYVKQNTDSVQLNRSRRHLGPPQRVRGVLDITEIDDDDDAGSSGEAHSKNKNVESQDHSTDDNMATQRIKTPKITRADIGYMLNWDPNGRRPRSAPSCNTGSHICNDNDLKENDELLNQSYTGHKAQRGTIDETVVKPECDEGTLCSGGTANNNPIHSGCVNSVQPVRAESNRFHCEPKLASDHQESKKYSEEKSIFLTKSITGEKATDHNDAELKPLPLHTKSAAPASPERKESTVSSSPPTLDGLNAAFLPLVCESNIIHVNRYPFVKLGVIGKGGSCKVYRALSKDRTIVAIKKVNLSGMNKKAIEGYANEIMLLRKLKGNAAIIQLQDSEIDIKRKAIFLVMELGEIDLNHVLQQQQSNQIGTEMSQSSLNMNFIRLTWQQMLSAVHSIHQERIIHGDLKPANFLFVKGALKLIDFGIAKAIQSDDTNNIYRDSQIGTLNYMSPESIQDTGTCANGGVRMRCGKPSDVWSLGCILYQMCYGKTPFADLNMFQKLQAIINPSYQISFPNTIDESAIDAIQLCLKRKPEDRATITGNNGLLTDHCFLHSKRRQ